MLQSSLVTGASPVSSYTTILGGKPDPGGQHHRHLHQQEHLGSHDHWDASPTITVCNKVVK